MTGHAVVLDTTACVFDNEFYALLSGAIPQILGPLMDQKRK